MSDDLTQPEAMVKYFPDKMSDQNQNLISYFLYIYTIYISYIPFPFKIRIHYTSPIRSYRLIHVLLWQFTALTSSDNIYTAYAAHS